MATQQDIQDFIERYLRIENEKVLLTDDMKQLFEEFKEKVDPKALRAAIRIAKIKSKLGDAESEMETILAVVEGHIR